MAAAGSEFLRCIRALTKTGDSLLTAAVGHDRPPEPWVHYPVGDVFDDEFGAQFYFHRHPNGATQGHFHLFMHPRSDPASAGEPPSPAHLIAVDINGAGLPCRLFTTNRWVTGEGWQDAATIRPLIDRFRVDHARPSWPLNLAITALVRLFAPQIRLLIDARDARMSSLCAQSGTACEALMEDRSIEILSSLDIDLHGQIAMVAAALGRLDCGASPA